MAIFTGTAVDDLLDGTASNDTLSGLGGNDILNGGAGADTLDGGTGSDTATYANAAAGVGANLSATPQQLTGEAFGDVYISIENLTGSAFNDYLAGNEFDNTLRGGAGEDTLYGYGGTNYLYGDDGADTLIGGDGIDHMFGGAGTDPLRFTGDTVSYQLWRQGGDTDSVFVSTRTGATISLANQASNTGAAAGDTYDSIEDVTGTVYRDVIYGDNGSLNNLWGLEGDDEIYGLGGTDILIGNAGADRLDGGDGRDIADYEVWRFHESEVNGVSVNVSGFADQTGITASFFNPSINTGHAAGDTYFSVEDMAGSLFNDTLEGDNNANNFLAWAGNDIVRGLGGNDSLEGMPGADLLDGGDGEDTASYASAGTLVISSWGFYTQVGQGVTASLLNPAINTSDAAGDSYVSIENLLGSTFADVLQGNNLANAILGQGGNDTLLGEGGDDTLEGGAGADALNGGAGYDFASYADAASNVQVALDLSLAAFGDAVGDTFTSIEGVLGSAFNDVIYGDGNGNTLQGGAGNDNLNGQGGDDLIVGGAGADSMTGGSGNDTASYQDARAAVTVNLQNGSLNTGDAAGDVIVGFEFLHGSAFGDSLTGYSFASNNIRGLAGNDTLTGGFADDILIGDAGADALVGGEGYDLASYSTATAGVVANLLAPAGNTGDAAGDTYNGIENLAGSDYGDTLTGNVGDNILLGLAGDDTLDGGDGNDGLEGGDGNDALNGGNGNDRFIGGAGSDTQSGGAGDDIFFGGTGADSMDGGDGTDLLTYENATAGVSALMAGGGAGANDSQGDTYANIENLIGSAFGDTLGGNALNNYLYGRVGNDTLSGGGGEDHLLGGLGADALDGSGGYAYADYSEATAGVSAYLTWAAGGSGEAAGDTFVSIEGLTGSAYADVLSGNEVDNTVQAGDGNDWLFGREGQDALYGGNGNDVLSGGSGSTVNNFGGDLLDGGAGIDVAYYRDAPSTVFSVAQVGNKLGMVDGRSYGISIDIANGANNFGEAVGDVLVNVENIWGSRFDDVIRGDDNGGQIYGFEGNDILDGRGGDDVFYGGTGADILTGGAGAEDFFYLSYNDHYNQYGTLEANEGGDTITDFATGVDHITVSRYWFGFGNIGGPAAALTAQHADFITSGSAASSTKPTFFWNAATGALLFDADGTGGTAAVNIATLTNGATMTLNDIWTA